MKKIFMLLLVLLIAATISLTGCSTLETPSEESTDAVTDSSAEMEPADSRSPEDFVDSEPSESLYDVLSNPNVHWGTWEEALEEQSMWALNYGDVRYGPLMTELLDQLEDDDLVAFWLITAFDHSIDADPVVEALPNEVKQNASVRYWLNHSDETNAWKKFKSAVISYATSKADNCEDWMRYYRNEAEKTVRNEYDGKEIDEELFNAEVEALLLESEKYQNAYADYIHYKTMHSDFLRSIYGQQVENIRSKFIGRGFVPVFDFDYEALFETPYEERDTSYREQGLTFVGPAGTLRELAALLDYGECYWVLSVGKVVPDEP